MELKLKKLINTTSEACYNSFTEPEHLSKWFTTNAKADLMIGGRYSNDDKDEGEFLELKPFDLIAFTWENKEHCPGTEVKVEFISLDKNKTKIILTHSMLQNELHVKDMTTGWTWALESVKQYLETGKRLTYSEWENTFNK